MIRLLYIVIAFSMISVCGISGWMVSHHALAQEPDDNAQTYSLSISPPVIEVYIQPGKSITQAFTITNKGQDAIIIPQLMEYGENGLKENSAYVPESWLSLKNQDIALNTPVLLATNTSRQLVLEINPEEQIPQQDYYRALVVTTQPPPSSETSQSAISQRIGAILLIAVTKTGMVEKKAQITKFDTPKIQDSFSPFTATIDVQNTGNSYFRTIGDMTLTGPFMKSSFDLSPQIILSGQTRMLRTQNAANDTLQTSVSIPGFYLGKYDIETTFSLDESAIVLSQKQSVYALPWKAGIVLACGCIFVFIMRKTTKRKHKKDTTVKK